VRGENAISVGELWCCGGNWSGVSCSDSFEALKEVVEDIGSMKRERGGAECIASCCCSW
jgi:hypothetical protein